MNELSDIDLRILRALQSEGRVSHDELAARIGVSATTVMRRVRKLEAAGVISGYRAVLEPRQLGLGVVAYINVRLEKQQFDARHNPMDLFRAAVQSWPAVTECISLTGDMDFLLKVVARDIDHFAAFLSDTLLRHPAVRDCKSSFMLEAFKKDAPYPI